MNTSPRRSPEEPQRSPQQVLFEKLSKLRSVLRDMLLDITRSGVKKSVVELELDLMFQDFAQEFGFIAKTSDEEHVNDAKDIKAMKKRIQEMNHEITALLRIFGTGKQWSKGQESKARLLLYRVEEFICEM